MTGASDMIHDLQAEITQVKYENKRLLQEGRDMARVLRSTTEENERLAANQCIGDCENRLIEAQDEALGLREQIEWLTAQHEHVCATIKRHYPSIAGRAMRLKEAGEARAAAEWTAVAEDFAELID